MPTKEPLNKSGGCHCGKLRYTFSFPDVETLPARACSCSFCIRHGGVYTSHPAAKLVVETAEPENTGRYRFGHETAEFFLCRNCGVLVFASCEINGARRAVLNINTFDDNRGPVFERSVTNFDGETVVQRLERRARNWIGSVTLVEQTRR